MNNLNESQPADRQNENLCDGIASLRGSENHTGGGEWLDQRMSHRVHTIMGDVPDIFEKADLNLNDKILMAALAKDELSSDEMLVWGRRVLETLKYMAELFRTHEAIKLGGIDRTPGIEVGISPRHPLVTESNKELLKVASAISGKLHDLEKAGFTSVRGVRSEIESARDTHNQVFGAFEHGESIRAVLATPGAKRVGDQFQFIMRQFQKHPEALHRAPHEQFHSPEYDELCSAIRGYLSTNDMTQGQFARTVGVHQTALSNFFSAKFPLPSDGLNRIRKLVGKSGAKAAEQTNPRDRQAGA